MKKLFILILTIGFFSVASSAYAGSGSSCGMSYGEPANTTAPVKPVKKAKSVKKLKASKPVVKTENAPAPATK